MQVMPNSKEQPVRVSTAESETPSLKQKLDGDARCDGRWPMDVKKNWLALADTSYRYLVRPLTCLCSLRIGVKIQMVQARTASSLIHSDNTRSLL
jgi:hypothetical protein